MRIRVNPKEDKDEAAGHVAFIQDHEFQSQIKWGNKSGGEVKEDEGRNEWEDDKKRWGQGSNH